MAFLMGKYLILKICEEKENQFKEHDTDSIDEMKSLIHYTQKD